MFKKLKIYDPQAPQLSGYNAECLPIKHNSTALQTGGTATSIATSSFIPIPRVQGWLLSWMQKIKHKNSFKGRRS